MDQNQYSVENRVVINAVIHAKKSLSKMGELSTISLLLSENGVSTTSSIKLGVSCDSKTFWLLWKFIYITFFTYLVTFK